MAERLTESEVSKSFTEQELRTSNQARIYQKLGKLEDIMEKYGIESVEELENIIINGLAMLDIQKINILKEMELKTDRDTWKKACELASETLKQVMGKPLWIGGNIPAPEVKDTEYFYQQAKTEGNDDK